MLNGFFHYTFLDRRLIGSEHPGAKGNPRERIQRMMEGPCAMAMLTLAGRFEGSGIPGLVQYHLPMPSIPDRRQVADAAAIVRSHLDKGDRVWVHCLHGLDRTGCVIGAYLCQSGVDAEQVVEMLLERFPPRRRHPQMLKLWRPFEE